MEKQLTLELDGGGCFILNLEDGGGTCVCDQHSFFKPENKDEEIYNASIDVLESLVLAHACAGIDVTSNQYKEGLEITIQAIANQ